MLGRDDTGAAEFFGLVESQRSNHWSPSEASGVMCANWDTADAFDLPSMIAKGYQAPLESRSSFFNSAGGCEDVRGSLGLAGCTPGVGNACNAVA